LDEPSPEVVVDVIERAIDIDITAATRVEEGLNAVYLDTARESRRLRRA
jgi:hypothetical protein